MYLAEIQPRVGKLKRVAKSIMQIQSHNHFGRDNTVCFNIVRMRTVDKIVPPEQGAYRHISSEVLSLQIAVDSAIFVHTFAHDQ